MSKSMKDEAEQFEANFYEKLMAKKSAAFSKLYTSSGSSAEFPEFPKHLEEESYDLAS